MGRSRCLPVLLISALLLISFSQGFGRKFMQAIGNEEKSAVRLEENAVLSREMIELDYGYDEPGPNTNPKSAYNPPPPAPPPAPPARPPAS